MKHYKVTLHKQPDFATKKTEWYIFSGVTICTMPQLVSGLPMGGIITHVDLADIASIEPVEEGQ